MVATTVMGQFMGEDSLQLLARDVFQETFREHDHRLSPAWPKKRADFAGNNDHFGELLDLQHRADVLCHRVEVFAGWSSQAQQTLKSKDSSKSDQQEDATACEGDDLQNQQAIGFTERPGLFQPLWPAWGRCSDGWLSGMIEPLERMPALP